MKQVLLCAALLCVATINASAQNIEWAKRVLSGGGQVLNGAHTDANGNNYVTGYFGGAIQLGGTTLQGNGLGDMFIIKYGPDGEAIWGRQSRSEGWEGGRAIASDPAGNVYCAGRIEGTSQLGSQTLNAVGSNDALIVKYDSDGEVQWARAGGGVGLDWANGTAVDAQGNVLIVGQYVGSASFGSRNLNGNGDNNEAFIVKYNANGDVLWALSGGGNGEDWAYDVATDADGAAYVVGSFEGSANIFGRSLSSNGGVDAFIAKVSASGNVEWAHAIGSGDVDLAESIDARADGSLVIAGSFRGSNCSVAGAATLQNSGEADVFVAQFAGDGSLNSALAFGGTGVEGIAGFGQSMAVEAGPDGSFWLTSSFSGQMTVGTTTLNSAGESDIFTGLFDADGTPEWTMTAGGSVADNFVAMGVGPTGDVFLVGNYFSNPLRFGDFTFGYTGPLLSCFVGKITLEDLVLPATMGLSTTILEYGEVAVGEPAMQTLTIESLGDENLEIIALSHFDPEAADKGFRIIAPDVNSLPISLAKGETLDIEVEFTPAALGEVLSDITVESNDESSSFEIIDLTGNGVEAGGESRVELNITELDFDEVVEGESKTLSFNIESQGSAPLRINSIEFVNSDAQALGFEILAPELSVFPMNLEQGQVLRVEVEFTPAALGEVVSTLRINSNAANSPELDLPLRGEGMQASTSVHETTVEQDGFSVALAQGGNVVNRALDLNVMLRSAANVRLQLLDLNGRQAQPFASQNLNSGVHALSFDVSALVRGMYVLQVRAHDVVLRLPLLLQ